MIKSWVDFFLGTGIGMLLLAVIAVVVILKFMKWK